MSFWCLQFSQKTYEKIRLTVLWYLKSNCFCSFFGRIKDTKRTFRNLQTFSTFTHTYSCMPLPCHAMPWGIRLIDIEKSTHASFYPLSPDSSWLFLRHEVYYSRSWDPWSRFSWRFCERDKKRKGRRPAVSANSLAFFLTEKL